MHHQRAIFALTLILGVCSLGLGTAADFQGMRGRWIVSHDLRGWSRVCHCGATALVAAYLLGDLLAWIHPVRRFPEISPRAPDEEITREPALQDRVRVR